MSTSQETAFPRLSTAEFDVLKSLATVHDCVDGETIFRVGQADIDLFVVESGQIDILNPTDEQSGDCHPRTGSVLRRHRSLHHL